MISNRNFYLLIQHFLVLTALLSTSFLQAQERWFQIEVSIFSNEVMADRVKEEWQADRIKLSYPGNIRRLNSIAELFLPDPSAGKNQIFSNESSEGIMEMEARRLAIEKIRPRRRKNRANFKLINLSREPYIQLPKDESDFQQTNRALERSPDHRLLFHGNWKQSVTQKSLATSILIEGGLAYDHQYELQGSLTVRFNQNEDRVVLDANLWLAEFSIIENIEENWSLPSIPEHLQNRREGLESTLNYFPKTIYHMNQSREMRSMEFHYLDHPGLGLVVSVKPVDLSGL